MLSGLLVLAAVQGVAIRLPQKENHQGFPVTTKEKLRFTAGNVVMLVIIGVVAWAN